MFVQSEKFAEAHGGRIGDISVYGQESNPNTFKLARMNLAIRGIEGDLGKEPADSFHNDQHPDLKADFILANPPFNMSDWGGEALREDKRWKYGIPPAGNANFAWVQHFIYHLSPNGAAGFVLANGNAWAATHPARARFVKPSLRMTWWIASCRAAGQLFYSTQIPVCLWFLSRNKKTRQGKTLFIDARKLETLFDRVHRELTDEDIAKIANAYHQCGRAGMRAIRIFKGFVNRQHWMRSGDRAMC